MYSVHQGLFWCAIPQMFVFHLLKPDPNMLMCAGEACKRWLGHEGASQVALMVKNPPANVGDIRDVGSIPELERYPGGGHGNPLQYSRLENAMDRRAWQAIVHWAAKSQTWLKWLSMHTHRSWEQSLMNEINTFYRGPQRASSALPLHEAAARRTSVNQIPNLLEASA